MRQRRNKAERAVIAEMEADGWTVLTRGWPDLFCMRGKELRLIEVKSRLSSGNQLPTKHQAVILAVLRAHGIPTEVRMSGEGGINEDDCSFHLSNRAERNKERDKLMGIDSPWRENIGNNPGLIPQRGTVHIRQRFRTILVESPYSVEFITGAKRLGARWENKARVWTFKRGDKAEVVALITQCFGIEKIPAWLLP